MHLAKTSELSYQANSQLYNFMTDQSYESFKIAPIYLVLCVIEGSLQDHI